MVSLRDRVSKIKDRKEETIRIPEWDVTDDAGAVVEECHITVKSFSSKLRSVILQSGIDNEGKPNLVETYPDVVIESAYYPDNFSDAEYAGKRIFQKGDEPLIEERGYEAVERIAETAIRLSMVTAGAVDEAVKNSSPTPNSEPVSK